MEETLMQNPYYAAAIKYINSTNLNTLEPGKHFLDGDNLFVIIVDADLRSKEEAKLEVHDRYIDVQVPLSVEESFGVKPRIECRQPIGTMDTTNDIMFFDDPIVETITAQPGDIITFAPDTAHAPLIGKGKTHKAIFKVRVTE